MELEYDQRCRTQLMRWCLWTLGLAVTSLTLSALRDFGVPLPAAARYSIIAAAVVAVGFWVRASVVLVQRLDELHRRIYLEAGATTGLGAMAGAIVYPVLEKLGVIGPLTHDHVQMFLLPLAGISFALAFRRYL